MPDHRGPTHAHPATAVPAVPAGHGALVDHEPDETAFAELLDLDGEVLRPFWTDVLTRVHDAAPAAGRVVDLGAGSGVGTIALAQLFTDAEIIAVDAAEEMLRRIRARAVRLGLDQRVRTIVADLDRPWPIGDPVDVTWASLSLHHLADPDRVLGDVFAATRPGGLVAVIEMNEPLRVLPHDVGFGRPGLEERCLVAMGAEHARALPELGSDWGPRLEAAGFTLISDQTITIDEPRPATPGTARYAQLWLERLRSHLASQLTSEDLDTLAVLIDGDGPGSVRHRDDLQIRGSRTLALARRA